MTDSHAHLNDERLVDIAETVVSEAKAVGVHTIINVGCALEDSILAIRQANCFDGVYASVGLHPHTASDAINSAYYNNFIDLCDDKKVVAYGEIGLDYHYDFSPREKQKEVFAEQIRVADQLGLPIVLHIREAFLDTQNILKDSKKYLNNGVLVHCYSGSNELTSFFNSLDCYYSFGGILTFAKNKQPIIASIPQNRLLLETDCPYMTPIPYRGQTNYPKYIPLVLQKLCEMLNISVQDGEIITDENAKRFYRLK